MLYLFGGPILEGFADHAHRAPSVRLFIHCRVRAGFSKLGMKREHMLQQKVEKEGRISRQFCRKAIA